MRSKLLNKLLISSVLCIANITVLSAQSSSVTATQTANSSQFMDQAIQKAEARVQELQKNATRQDIMPTWSSKLELENAIIQLEVKKTLVSKFRGTPSMNSPQVSTKLMQILNNDSVSESDIMELQSLADQYRASQNANTSRPISPINSTVK